MFKKQLTWHDFNDKPHTEDFYFHMMVPEFADMNFNPMFGPGGLGSYMKQVMPENDGQKIHTVFKLLVVNSYGRRSEDGSQFRKKAEWTEEFLDSPAWEQFFLWLTDEEGGHKNAASFWEGIFPEAMRGQVESAVESVSGQTDMSKLSREQLELLLAKTLEGRRAIDGSTTTTA